MRLLFVCTGNLCRSPLAEYLFRRRVAELELDGFEAASAGTHAPVGAPALVAAALAGSRRGLDLSPHRARRFEAALVGPADLVLTMERQHARVIQAVFRVAPERVRLLGSYAPEGGEEIGDPIGGPESAFDECYERIAACVEGLVRELRTR